MASIVFIVLFYFGGGGSSKFCKIPAYAQHKIPSYTGRGSLCNRITGYRPVKVQILVKQVINRQDQFKVIVLKK